MSMPGRLGRGAAVMVALCVCVWWWCSLTPHTPLELRSSTHQDSDFSKNYTLLKQLALIKNGFRDTDAPPRSPPGTAEGSGQGSGSGGDHGGGYPPTGRGGGGARPPTPARICDCDNDNIDIFVPGNDTELTPKMQMAAGLTSFPYHVHFDELDQALYDSTRVHDDIYSRSLYIPSTDMGAPGVSSYPLEWWYPGDNCTVNNSHQDRPPA